MSFDSLLNKEEEEEALSFDEISKSPTCVFEVRAEWKRITGRVRVH